MGSGCFCELVRLEFLKYFYFVGVGSCLFMKFCVLRGKGLKLRPVAWLEPLNGRGGGIVQGD